MLNHAVSHEQMVQPRAAPAHSRYPRFYKFRAPVGFHEAVAAVAAQNHQTSSDYCRQLLLREMRKAGVTLRLDGRVEAPAP
jgi:hypothetical protein